MLNAKTIIILASILTTSFVFSYFLLHVYAVWHSLFTFHNHPGRNRQYFPAQMSFLTYTYLFLPTILLSIFAKGRAFPMAMVRVTTGPLPRAHQYQGTSSV